MERRHIFIIGHIYMAASLVCLASFLEPFPRAILVFVTFALADVFFIAGLTVKDTYRRR